MSSTTVTLSSAGGAASACSPLNRRTTSAISTALYASTTSKKSLVFPSSSASSSTSIANNTAMIIPHLSLGRNCYSTTPASNMIKGRRRISCEVALRSSDSAASSTTVAEGEPEMKIGAKVRVKVPLKVYHVPRVPELDLTGKEGHIKRYVALWKGKRISANLPYKVELVVDVEGRGPVKFLVHLKEDEFEYLD